MTDADALLAAIVANPDEDLHRLVYADLLDEQPTESVPCRTCGGRGKRLADGHHYDRTYEKCDRCGGSKVTPDTWNHDRAEFIRVQCELHRLTTQVPCTLAYYREEAKSEMLAKMTRLERGGRLDELEHKAHCEGMKRVDALLGNIERFKVRSEALLAAHDREWLGGAKCRHCGGKGGGVYGLEETDWDCESCRGTGWACWPLVGKLHHRPEGQEFIEETGYAIRSTFRRGFLDRIELTHGQFMAPGVAGLIGKCHPTIREVGLTDCTPVSITLDRRTVFSWQIGEHGPTTPGFLPEELYLAIDDDDPIQVDWGGGYTAWPTPYAARAALSRACVQYLRDGAVKLSR